MSIFYPLNKEDLDAFYEMRGELKVRMCNDLLFHIVMQESETALKSLVGACLHIPVMKIHSIEVMNVIVPGTRINEKTCILDILLTLNHERTLNIEMQVLNEYDWTDRSLVYLSRIFNNVNSGEEYSDVIPATHIGFLNFQLFKDDPAFFSEFKISNVKTHKVYSDKFVLDVVSLNCIDLATPEDVESGLVDWARFFTASTWEELQMLAANNPAIEDAASTAVKGMSDDKLKWEIMLREEASRRYQTREAFFKRAEKRAGEAEEKLAVSEEKLAVSEEKLAETDKKLAETDKKLAETDKKLAETDKKLAETDKKLTEAERKNSDLEAEVTRLREALSKYE